MLCNSSLGCPERAYASSWVILLLKLNYLVRACVEGTVGSSEVNCTQEVEVIAFI